MQVRTNFIQNQRSYPIFSVFIKIWLPWQRFIVPKLYHLCSHLYIHTFYPWKFEKISFKNEVSHMFPLLSLKCVTMATPHLTQVISPLRTSTHPYLSSIQVWTKYQRYLSSNLAFGTHSKMFLCFMFAHEYWLLLLMNIHL